MKTILSIKMMGGMLEVKDTARGMLVSCMTKAQRLAIESQANGDYRIQESYQE